MGEASTTAPLYILQSKGKVQPTPENADKNSTLQARKKPNLREMPQSFEVFWSRATSQKGLEHFEG